MKKQEVCYFLRSVWGGGIKKWAAGSKFIEAM